MFDLDISQTATTGDVSASAAFHDTLEVLGYSGSGFIQYHISGGLSGGGTTLAVFRLNGELDPITTSFEPFTAGVPFPLMFSVNLAANLSEEEANESFVGVIDQISVFDSNMQPLRNYVLVSASGTDYPATGEVPEPSTLLLLPTVLLLSLLTGKLRSHRVRTAQFR